MLRQIQHSFRWQGLRNAAPESTPEWSLIFSRLIQPNERLPQFKAYDPLLGSRCGITIRQIEMKAAAVAKQNLPALARFQRLRVNERNDTEWDDLHRDVMSAPATLQR
jgi:hypothetical protein